MFSAIMILYLKKKKKKSNGNNLSFDCSQLGDRKQGSFMEFFKS